MKFRDSTAANSLARHQAADVSRLHLADGWDIANDRSGESDEK